MTKYCLICNAEFITYKYLILKGYGKYCSMTCSSKSQDKTITKNCAICQKQFSVHLFRVKEGDGIYCSSECCGISKRLTENGSTKTIHQWIKRKLGYPNKCELCGTTRGSFDWANKDHTYKRNLEDWMRLCRSCHRKYDIANNGYKLGYLNK